MRPTRRSRSGALPKPSKSAAAGGLCMSAATADGKVPESFPDQCRLAWANVIAQLRAADMSLDNLVKVTTFLSDRRFGLENRAIRQEVLGERRPALTVVITGIFDAAWLVEIEGVAVA